MSNLRDAIQTGDLERVSALISDGADLHYKNEEGYCAAVDAAYAAHGLDDPRLLDLFRFLISHGVNLDGETCHGESALRVLSRIGRFEVIRMLLASGADKTPLGWTPLIEAVALGTCADVASTLQSGAALEDRDTWERTAWHVALLAGDLGKAQLLIDHGADLHARARCGTPPLHFAIEGRHAHVLRWLLQRGADPNAANEFGWTALMIAVEAADLECVNVLLDAGADVEADANGTALQRAASREIVLRLLDAGANPADLSKHGRRALLGYPPNSEERETFSWPADTRTVSARTFGRSNPERMAIRFWEQMIRSGADAYAARSQFEQHAGKFTDPVWCADRFGQSFTILDDGRIVQIGGEHEDYYMPDFCIYNDVFVHGPDGSLTIYGYPDEVFPPTDFHTATPLGDFIYVIGSLGYAGSRRYGETPVYRLDLRSFQIDPIFPTGEAPGWIYGHRAAILGPGNIRVWSGTIVTAGEPTELHEKNKHSFVLNVEQMAWRRD